MVDQRAGYRVIHRPHHVYAVNAHFLDEHISQVQANAMLACDGSLQVYRSCLYILDDPNCSVFLAFGTDDRSMVVS